MTISFNLAPGAALGDATRLIEQTQLEMRFPATIHGSFQGTAAAFQDSLSSEPLLILAALVAVYIVLGMLYESYIHPITILSTIPSAGTGALLGLMLFHMELNVIGLVGILLLIGIVKKNAIMMIDFALERERQGKTPLDAIHEAALLRFRPIMMTTAAALLGAVPLAFGTGHGFGTAASAGRRDCRRLDGQPDADDLHHARRVSVPRSLADMARGASAVAQEAVAERRKFRSSRTESQPTSHATTYVDFAGRALAAVSVFGHGNLVAGQSRETSEKYRLIPLHLASPGNGNRSATSMADDS